MSGHRFPVLDFDRESDALYVGARHVVSETSIEPVVAETGEWITLPVRSVIDAGGPTVEIGPYSLTETDVARLHNVLLDHIRAFPEDFRVRG